MNRTSLLLGLGTVSLVSLVAESGCSLVPVKVGTQAIDDSGEPEAPYIIQFNGAELKSMADRTAFIKALGSDKVVFRHNMAIPKSDLTGCDSTSLPNIGLNHPNPSNPCERMGQQVTQRVGFKNRDNLREALKHLKNQT
jgi:hypothetical protein